MRWAVPRSILVVKLRNIGDVLLVTPLMRCLRENFPQSRICLLVNSGTEEMVTLNPDVDEIVVFDRSCKQGSLVKRVAAEVKFAAQIAKKRYDLAINLTEGDRGAVYTLLSRAQIRIGWDPEGKGLWGKRYFFDHLVGCSRNRHMVEWNLETLRPLGVKVRVLPTRLHYAYEDMSLAISFLRAAEVQIDEPFVHVHPTARWLFKCWPDDRISQVIDHLAERYGLRCIMTCGPDPKEMARLDSIEQRSRSRPVNLGGRLTLKQVAAVSHMSLFYFGVDTAPMHMAAAVGTPVVAVFGPSNEKVWGPLGDDDLVIHKDWSCRPCSRDGCNGSKISRCLEELTTSEVIARLDAWLEQLEWKGRRPRL